jgi:hypothetical protein
VPIITSAGIVYPGFSTGDAGQPGVTPAGGGSNVAGTGGSVTGCTSNGVTASDSVAGSNAIGGDGGTGGDASSLGPMYSGCNMSVGNCFDAGPGGGGGGGYGGGGGGATGTDKVSGNCGACNGASNGQGGGGGSSFVSNQMMDPVDQQQALSQWNGAANLVPAIEIDTPANGAVYAPGQVIAANWSCDPNNDFWGNLDCTSAIANGSPIDTSPGTHTFTVSGIAYSNGYHPVSASVTYTVTSGSGSGGNGSSTPGTPTLGVPHVAGTTASLPVSCAGAAGASCTLTLTLSVVETVKGGKVIAVMASAGKHQKTKKKTVVLGTATVTLLSGQSRTVRISLNGRGRQLLATRHTLSANLAVVQEGKRIASRTITFKARKPKRKHGR